MTLITKVGFIQKIDEHEYKHENIYCPTDECMDGKVLKCNAVSPVDDNYFVCVDCPINWEFLRIIGPVKDIELPEKEYEHRKIKCPLLYNSAIDCDGKFAWFSSGPFNPCDDCPIDWKKLRINFEYQTRKLSKTRCKNCAFGGPGELEGCKGGGFKSGYNYDWEIECQNWKPQLGV